MVAERASIQDFASPDGRRARLIANPIRSAGTEWPRRAAPALGADTDALLRLIETGAPSGLPFIAPGAPS